MIISMTSLSCLSAACNVSASPARRSCSYPFPSVGLGAAIVRARPNGAYPPNGATCMRNERRHSKRAVPGRGGQRHRSVAPLSDDLEPRSRRLEIQYGADVSSLNAEPMVPMSDPGRRFRRTRFFHPTTSNDRGGSRPELLPFRSHGNNNTDQLAHVGGARHRFRARSCAELYEYALQV